MHWRDSKEGGKDQGHLSDLGPGCLVDGDRGPWVGMGACRPCCLLAGTSLSLRPLSFLLSLSGSPRLTHFWFAPLGFGCETGRLGELHPGESRLDRDCTGVLLKEKGPWGEGKL